VLRRISKCFRNNGGQSIVEFAIIVPVLLFLLAGIIDFGRLIYRYEMVVQATREASLAVAKSGNRKTANTAALAYLTAGVNATVVDNLTVTVSPTPMKAANPVTVTVSCSMNMLFPVMSAILSSPYTVSSTSTVMLQTSPTN